MSAVKEGILDGSGKRFGIVVSRFNDLISKKLLEGAMDCLLRHKTEKDAITVVWAPGALEIPLVAQKMAASKKYDAVICLGAVIRGGTPHFEYVAAESAKGIASIALEQKLPVINGILTTDTIDQAIERAGTKSGNKGWGAAQNAIEMADLLSKL
ncbi:MAG: 6,7-dimethyl-8-ribityllumazine synthase [Chitinispirillaceae bacterium]|jgi:6,7-dimethyl-8-ribityllumazine synthase|nr:6,7-dimethyl-8-ribityllumazine synthase [Chitinispirillaceae bacterium]